MNTGVPALSPTPPPDDRSPVVLGREPLLDPQLF